MAEVKSNVLIHKAGSEFQLTSLQKTATMNCSEVDKNECVVVSEEDKESPSLVYVIPGNFDGAGTYVAPTGKSYNPVTVTGGGGGAKTQTPTFSSAPGHVEEGTKITISCATEGATIHYTTDGTEATLSSPVYTAGTQISVPDTGITINAVAVLLGLATSAQASGFFTTGEEPTPADPTLYYCGWLVAKDDNPVSSITEEQVLGLSGSFSGKATGTDSPDPTIYVTPADCDPAQDPTSHGGRITYAYPAKFGDCSFFTDGLGKHAILDSYTALTCEIAGTNYRVYVLTDAITPDVGDEYPQRFTAN